MFTADRICLHFLGAGVLGDFVLYSALYRWSFPSLWGNFVYFHGAGLVAVFIITFVCGGGILRSGWSGR